MARLAYAEPARADLDIIHSYIARESVRRAEAVVSRILAGIDKLALTPRMGHRRLEYGAETRTLPIYPYVVFYRLTDSDRVVQIIRIIDGRRDLGTVFFSPLAA